ncbi:MAG TPA: Hpt domain-containing protein [Oligoflexus sp.]|uniref:Hpt domain-containing protein n=1 Tax=Oligoflexus sp. TaxID=1971216 RepID=UPI002D4BC74B|nr:Hpt domain-containing protein [Oligoflexus sp.]HYX34309.1 Hpt domain-containing protein [Oligoflexus sp.]
MIVEVDKELEDVFPRYLRNREEDMVKIQSALEKKDFETLRQIGHKLAGNASGYGLLGLGEMAKALEHAAGSRQYDNCRNVISQMKAYLTDLQPKFV